MIDQGWTVFSVHRPFLKFEKLLMFVFSTITSVSTDLFKKFFPWPHSSAFDATPAHRP